MFSSNSNSNHQDINLVAEYARLLINYLKEHSDKLGSRVKLLGEYQMRLNQADDNSDVYLVNEDIKDLVLEITSRQHYREASELLNQNLPARNDTASDLKRKIDAIKRYIGSAAKKDLQRSARSADEYDRLLKFVVVGDQGVGKSCMLLRFADDVYSENYISTIGVDFKNKIIDVNGKRVKLQIWDTMGQTQRVLTNSHYRGAHGYVIAFDLTDRISFTNAKHMMDEINRYVHENTPVLIVGTKSDLVSQRVVEIEDARAFTESVGCDYIETSAKNGTNVDAAFVTLSKTALSRILPKQLQVNGNIPNQLKSLLQNKEWHALTSHRGQPSGFKKMVSVLDKMANLSDADKLAAIKEIANERTGSVVKRFILPNGVRNLKLRRVYQKILDTNSLAEALVKIQDAHKELSQQQSYDARFK